jgi:hypothetical protein
MSGRVYLLGIAVVLVALAFVVTNAAIAPRPGVTEANALRIRQGMTFEQVDTILGKPAWTEVGYYPPAWNYNYWEVRWCAGPGGTVTVGFVGRRNSPPVVSSVTFTRTEQPSPLARLRDWLGW